MIKTNLSILHIKVHFGQYHALFNHFSLIFGVYVVNQLIGCLTSRIKCVLNTVIKILQHRFSIILNGTISLSVLLMKVR